MTPITTAKGKTTMTFTAVPVSDADMPVAAKKGGRQSNEPAIREFLSNVEPGNWYEMISGDDDKGHPVNRVTQIRKIAADQFDVKTAVLETGKRYRVFVRVASSPAPQ
ncbi:MAG: hypothetical protein ABW007_25220 [Chitinophagaceae bacterium]